MYTPSNARQVAVATVLVATLAGLLAVGLDAGGTPRVTGPVPTGATSAEAPVLLPEIVVTASRLEA